MKNLSRFCLALGTVFLLTVSPKVSFGITANGLKENLDKGQRVTIIDVRESRDYTAGHIPNAIHIPARIIVHKRLPPFGRVVVCGDGMDKGKTLEAVQALNDKVGIEADILKGGFPAWEALRFPSAHKMGVKPEAYRYITYEKLKKACENNRDMVLVDLRRPGVKKKASKSKRQDRDNRSLSNLSEAFPGLEVITPTRENSAEKGRTGSTSRAVLSAMKGGTSSGLYVFIDNGNGQAERVVRRLHAAGVKQMFILVGGEKALERDGLSGSKTEEGRRRF